MILVGFRNLSTRNPALSRLGVQSNHFCRSAAITVDDPFQGFHVPCYPHGVARSQRDSPPGHEREARLSWLQTTRQVGITLIIQAIPKRSATMPNRGDQNVFVSGILT